MFDMSKKRWFDRAVLIPGILIGVPLTVLGYAAVRLSSGKPGFYKQLRQGKDDVPFDIYKLRTMDSYKGKDGLVVSKVTKVGKFLRLTGIDEMPQLWNVIIGDMHIVGPRPRIYNIAGHEPEGRFAQEKLRNNSSILSVKPGITGPFQIASAFYPAREVFPLKTKNRIEEKYAENPVSITKDFLICSFTPFAMAYKAAFNRRDNSLTDKQNDRSPKLQKNSDVNILRNDDGVIIELFHFTQKDISSEGFRPFTHFGTCQAAHERWAGTNPSGSDSTFFPVVLNMTNPLRVKDTGDLGVRLGPETLLQAGVALEEIRWVFQPLLKGAVLNSEYDEQIRNNQSWNELHFDIEPSKNVPHDHKTSKIFGAYCGSDSYTVPLDKEDIIKEINFYTHVADPRRLLVYERMATALEEIGYDGLVYKNEEEDCGKDTYCIFHPEQAISSYSFNWNNEVRLQHKTRFNHRYYEIPEIWTPKP